MSNTLKTLFTYNVPLKVISLIIGYALWFALNQSHTATVEVDIPLCIYNTPAAYELDAPTTIHVTLAGKKNDLATLDLQAVAAHINGAPLHVGKNPIAIGPATLFLPEHIKLVNYSPTPVTIVVKTCKNDAQTASAAPEKTLGHETT